jgi:hypothetical protein
MKTMGYLVLFSVGSVLLGTYCESHKDPYEIGLHWDYSIICENGFIYKQMKYGIIPIVNSDGTPLKCGEKIY